MKRESERRYIRVHLTATVGVYFTEGSGADRSMTKETLLDRLHRTGDDHSDGRRPFSVEQIHDAAERMIRGAIEDLVEERFRPPGGTRGDGQRRKLEMGVASAMKNVLVNETEHDDDHTLMFEIEET